MRCFVLPPFKNPIPISMEKNNMYFDTRKSKIFKDLYRPTPNISRFIKSLFTVVLSGHSPVGTPAVYKRKFH
jgi:hypothetical protein